MGVPGMGFVLAARPCHAKTVLGGAVIAAAIGDALAGLVSMERLSPAWCLELSRSIVFLQRRNDLRRILSVEANRKVPVYATKDASEATKVRQEKVELDLKNLTYLLQRCLAQPDIRVGTPVVTGPKRPTAGWVPRCACEYRGYLDATGDKQKIQQVRQILGQAKAAP
eukprot:Skav208371  [mRNA]  locus=scaffold1964:699630:704558:- [translate_table: standard]